MPVRRRPSPRRTWVAAAGGHAAAAASRAAPLRSGWVPRRGRSARFVAAAAGAARRSRIRQSPSRTSSSPRPLVASSGPGPERATPTGGRGSRGRPDAGRACVRRSGDGRAWARRPRARGGCVAAADRERLGDRPLARLEQVPQALRQAGPRRDDRWRGRRPLQLGERAHGTVPAIALLDQRIERDRGQPVQLAEDGGLQAPAGLRGVRLRPVGRLRDHLVDHAQPLLVDRAHLHRQRPRSPPRRTSATGCSRSPRAR